MGRSRRYIARDPHWVTVRYPGKCRGCGAAIPRGARAFYYPNGKALYCESDGCGRAESLSFDAAVADERMLSVGGY